MLYLCDRKQLKTTITMKKALTLCLTALLTLTSWAADAEVYDFKGLNTTAAINRGESLGFTVNNGSNRTIYSFSIENVEMDCSRFGGFIGGATDGNFTLNANGLLLKGRILCVLNLKNGDKVTINYKVASGGSVTLADATLIGNTTDNSFESGTEYTISTSEESVHLDIIASANSNYIEKVTITPYEAPTPAPEPSGDAVSVFLTAGQSNTAGRCMNDNLPNYIKTLGTNNNGAYQYCNWSYTNGSTRKSESEGVFRKFWPEMESSSNNGRFAYDAIVYYWIEQALQKDFYVVKHAMGGTSIDPTCTSSNDFHWSADATWLAEHASCNTDGGTSMLKAFCDNIGASLDALTTDGKAYDIKAMIWHQGESDRSGTGPDNYYANLKAVVKYVRDYLVTKTGDNKYATLDFICGTVPKESKQYNKKVYDALFTLAQEDSHFHVIETAPGTFIGDQLHFDANCAERLGIGMYNKMVDLGLVSGTKQDVPEAIIPEGQPVTLDFKTWATDNVGDKNTQKALTLSTESIKALDGTTDIYKVIGCEAEGDFSEFAETFALSANEVKMRGAVGLQLNSNKVVTFSILNLNPGDGVTITFGAGGDATTLAVLSENIFVSTDETQTILTAGTALTSKTVTYVVKEGNQIDLTFGSTGGHYINSIVIEPGKVEINTDDPSGEPSGDPVVDPTDDPTTAVTIHTIGDSTMSHYDQSIAAQKGMDGWGDYLADCMKSEWTTVKNWADRGETAKSYYNGYWNGTKPDERPDFTQEINKEVNSGDYVIIQFGHNDSKAYDTATYEEWLGKLVDAVKEKGATPILAGSICRARFDSNGKITRLGRIDTGEENGVGEDDHTYDYPYHAKAVATAKIIEFIDVTTGVKEMFENYGEAKTKALFPSGEKTHTNKLGAQLIAKVAAKLLLNTALANYVDATKLELPAADDIDVIIDDFGTEATVTKKTIWTFNDVEAGTAISDGNNEIVNRNGLYVRGRADARAINAVASNLTSVTFSDNTQQAVSIMAQTAGANTAAESTVGQNTAGRAAANGLAPMFALNIATPGTFYAVMAPTKTATDRNINLFFSGKNVQSIAVNDAYAADNHLCELKYHAASTGVIYISAGVASNLYAAMFVPDMEAGTEEDWNYQMVLTREDGYWTYCNRMPENQKVPEGLTAYAVSAIDADGKAVLTDIGNVITPGMGVIVKGEPNTEYPMASTEDAATYTGENLLVGNATLQYLPATSGDKTNFYFENATTGFVKATGGETIHEKQAYLSVASTATNIALSIEENVEETDVELKDTEVSEQTMWTFDEYTRSYDKLVNYNDLFLHRGKLFTTDDSHLAATKGTFEGTEEAWEVSKALVVSQAADLSALGTITAASNEGPEASIAFNNKVAGTLYMVYGAASSNDGKFAIVHRATEATAFTTLKEADMEGIPYVGPLSVPRRIGQNVNFSLAQVAVELPAAGTVYLGGTQSYCLYAMLFKPALAEQPTVTLKGLTEDKTKSVYTLSYNSKDVLHYKMGADGEEVTPEVATAGTYDLEVSTSGILKAWATREHATTSDTTTVEVFVPTPAIEINGIYDFKTMKQDIDFMPITFESEAAATIGETAVYAPDIMTAQTFNGRFAFASDYKKWRFRKNNGIMIDKNKEATLAILNLKKDDTFRIFLNGITTAVNMTTDVITDAEIVSGTTYTAAQDGHLLLKVGVTTDGKNTYIEKVCIAEEELVTAPSLTLKVNSEDVSTQVTIRQGSSSFDKVVTTYYTLDGTDPTTESTAISKTTNVTMKQSCTVKAVTISETGVSSSISTLSVSVDNGVISAVDYTDSDVVLDGDRSENSLLKDIPDNVLIYVSSSSTVTGTNVVVKQEDGSYTCEDFQLTDGKSSSIPHAFTATSAKINRQFVADKKCTVCLPYDFTAAGGTFYQFTGVSNNKVLMTQQTGQLTANTPYIFVPAEGVDAIAAENVEVSISDAPQTVNESAQFAFIGTYEHIVWEAPVGIYGFAAEDNGLASVGQFVRVGAGASIDPYRAYLQYTGTGVISDAQSAPRRATSNLPSKMEIVWIAADGEVTGIQQVAGAQFAVDNCYNLNGQRVGKDYKGLVIMNGKTIVKK